jgi:acyl-CoA synthetase (NDP forming)
MIKPSNTKKKEISGIKCVVDVNSDILNDEVDAAITVVRKGQSKTINVSIRYAASV